MNTRRILRTLTLALLWGMAASTWAAIGHHLLGLPDIGIPAVIAAVAAVLGLPIVASRLDSQAQRPLSVARPSRPGG